MTDATTEPTTEATGEPAGGDDELSYEDAREQLVGIVAKLEGGAPLEESLALWERGEELASLCRTRLDRARQRIEERTADNPAGQPEQPDGAADTGHD